MKGRGRGAHQNRTVLEWNVFRQRNQACAWDDNKLRITPIAMLADHRPRRAELFLASEAEGAAAAGDEVMQTNPVSGPKTSHFTGNRLNQAVDRMTQRDG